MDRTKTIGRYEFSEKEHVHKLDGKNLTGVTTILGVIAKPALIQWSANMAVESIKSEIYELALMPLRTKLDEIFLRAKKAHTVKKEKAGELGTDIHAEVETLIKQAILSSGGILEAISATPQVQLFLDWAKQSKVKFLASEINIWSEKMWIGGICDFICEIDGKIWIGDIKTSTGIYEEAFFQIAGYDLCLKEMELYNNATGYLVVNLRKDGGFEEKRSISNDDNQLAFKSALTIYRVKEKIKNQVLNK